MDDKANFFTTSVSVRGLLSVSSIIVCCATLAGFLGELWPLMDLFSHFRVQYFLFLSASAVVYLTYRAFSHTIITLAFAMINLSLIAPFYFAPGSHGVNTQSYRAIIANVNTANQQYSRLITFIRAVDPHFIALLEINRKWAGSLRELKGRWPHSVQEVREDNFGISFLSRIRPSNLKVVTMGGVDLPVVICKMGLNGKSFKLVSIHAPPPLTSHYRKLNKTQIYAVVKYLQKTGGCDMLIGDLNASPWSSAYSHIISKTDLRDSRIGFGVMPSWPTTFPPLLIPVDHCLVSSRVTINGIELGPNVGSDHYPLVINFALQLRP